MKVNRMPLRLDPVVVAAESRGFSREWPEPLERVAALNDLLALAGFDATAEGLEAGDAVFQCKVSGPDRGLAWGWLVRASQRLPLWGTTDERRQLIADEVTGAPLWRAQTRGLAA